VGPIVCCVDDSEGARHALAFARLLASRLELQLVLLHVEPRTEAPGVSAAPAGQERLRAEELQDAESLLARLADEAGLEPGVRTRAAIGNAAATIVAV
jgi:nucleotide-binding universal stress UspA family protein